MQIDPDTLGPQQRFARPVSGPSYRPAFKWTAVSTLVSLAAYAARVLTERPDGLQAVSWHIALVCVAAAVLLVLSAWSILFGVTTVDAQGIRRSGLFRSELRWEQIGRASYLRVPLSPRLVVLPSAGPLRSFHAGNAELEQAFKEIAQLYRPG